MSKMFHEADLFYCTAGGKITHIRLLICFPSKASIIFLFDYLIVGVTFILKWFYREFSKLYFVNGSFNINNNIRDVIISVLTSSTIFGFTFMNRFSYF